MSKTVQPVAREEAPMHGDHPAMDFLNTVSRVDGQLVDSLQNDADVLRWLARAGWPMKEDAARLQPSSLIDTARVLRDTIRLAVERRKSGERNVAVLNTFLAEGQSHMNLVPDKDGGLRLERRWNQDTSEQMLAPVTESAAELLAMGDFDLVKRCENSECVLWFYDRTKSHRRRWCSMAACGNRNKVAAFRKRRQSSE
jgi:predicted RNA-binding Zn ribbon-like protein